MRSSVAIVFLFAHMLFALSCKNESSTSPDETFLSAPSIFVTVGLLRQPQGIAVDASGNVWVADTRAGKVRRFSSEGVLQDSISGFQLPTGMGVDRSNNTLVVIDNARVLRINPQTTSATIMTTLSGTTVDGSSVFDVNSRSTRSLTVGIQRLGDTDGTLLGDIFVSAHGTPENVVVRIRGGIAAAVASSSVAPQDSTQRGAHFLAVDGFGTVYSSFAFGSISPTVRVYAFSPSSPGLSHTLTEPFVTGAAGGAGMDASGNLYITDPATQELIIISTVSERTVSRYVIPDVSGYSMTPRDVAASADGKVYVVVTDRLGTEAGAVLRYVRTRQSR